MLIPGITASKPPAPSAYALLRADIDPDAWYRLNENSGTALFDSVSQSNLGLASTTNVQGLPIVDYTDDAGSLVMDDLESLSVPNSIPISWNPDGNTLETLWLSMWVLVDSLAAPITVLNSADPTRFNIVINTDGSVTFRYADVSVATTGAGLVVAGVRANISFWVQYQDTGAAFSGAAVRYNVAGIPGSGSVAAAYSPTRFPNLNLGGFTLGQFDGEIDEFFLRYGNVAGGDTIPQAKGIEWGQAIWDLQLAAGGLGAPAEWNPLDSVNTVVAGASNRDALLGDVADDTGVRSIAIPRVGKVYFELYVINQGDSVFGSLGIRKLIDPNPVGDDNPLADADSLYMKNTNLYRGTVTLPYGNASQHGLVGQLTGTTLMFAIDWSTGETWVGTDGAWNGENGTFAAGDPASGVNPVTTIDTTVDWGTWCCVVGAVGNQQYRIVASLADLTYAPPLGFKAWD